MSDDDVVSAVRAGDAATFGEAIGRYQRELQVHCYRMLGSFDESQDLVQETFLRAWTGRAGFRGDAPLRAWLYRIATNACLDFLEQHPRPALAAAKGAPPVRVPWLQPYPDELLEGIEARDATPEAAAVAKETIELTFLAAIQHLSAKERAVLILRDVLGWSAREATDVLGVSVAAVNSGLQRARLTMRVNLPQRRSDWTSAAGPSTDELPVLRRFMAALERADDHAVAALLREDVQVGHQGGAGGNLETDPVWYAGRETVIDAWAPLLHGPHARQLRFIPTRANRQPAYGTYARVPGSDGGFDAFAFTVLQIERGAVTEILTFGPELFAAFGLPATAH